MSLKPNCKFFYLKEYIPKNRGIEDIFSKKILKFKDNQKQIYINHFAKRILKKYKFIDQHEFSLVRAPSSNKENIANSCLKLIDKIIHFSSQNHLNASLFLKRHTSIEPQHRFNNTKRDIKIHFETISIEVSYLSLIQNNNIILFDDIYTSGSTMNACSEILFKNGAKQIIQIALGRTKIR